MANKGVKHIDSQKLVDAANQIDASIKDYNNVIKKISTTTTNLVSDWYGEGKTAFEKDYSTIYQQLSDVAEIMYDLYDAIVDAAATYVQTDEEIAKGLTMN
ncbi:MAG: WXG100 family type VII secretion target [Ruminococcus sp.]